jgi:S1-C subfamily serine protease
MSIARLTAAASFLALAGVFPAGAEELPLAPLGNYGKVVVTAKQSGGGAVRFEQAFGGEFDAEPASRYQENSVLRKLGRAVGRLDVAFTRGVGYCTAFLISDQHLMTNAHCLQGGQVQSISFIAGYVEEGVEEGTRIYTVGASPLELSPPGDLDYAILQVFGDPASEWGTLELADFDFDGARDGGMPLMILGHPVFQVAPEPVPQALYVSRKECRATATNPVAGKKLRHTCDTLQGNSGSPVLSDDSRKVIALHHAGSPREGINFAIPMSLIAQRSQIVAGLIAAGRAAPPQHVPQPDTSALDAALALSDALALTDPLARVVALGTVVTDFPGTRAAQRAATLADRERSREAERKRLTEEAEAAKRAQQQLDAERRKLAEAAQRATREKAAADRRARELAEAEQRRAEELARLKAERDRLQATLDNKRDGGADQTTGPVVRQGVTLALLDDARRRALGLDSSRQGLVVERIRTTSGAYRMGLRQGEVISEADQKPVRSISAFDAILDTARAEEKTRVLLLVHGKTGPRFVYLPLEAAEPAAVAASGSTVRFGLTLKSGGKGLQVTAVAPGSEAEQKSIRVGDEITEAGQQKIRTIRALDAAVTRAKGANRRTVLLLLRSDGNPRFVALPVADQFSGQD